MNTNPENFPPFKGRAPHAGSWNPNARSLRKFLGGIFSLLTIWLSLGHAAQSVTLAWDPSSDPNLAGFKVHFRAIAGSPRQSLNVGKTTTTKVSNLSDGTTYYFTVTAYDNWGHESGPSNEVSYKTAALGAHKLTVRDGSGSGQYTEGKRVIVTADKPAPGQEFDRWTGDWQILDNFLSPTTSALMLFRDLSITASYRGSEAIRYRPLTGFTERMVGGVFEGTDGDPVTGPYIPIYTIKTTPPTGWSEVHVSLGSSRYLRYRGAAGSYCVVAEIEFYRAGVKLLGTGYGTAGSWLNRGSTFDKALDGNANTYFSAPTATGNYVGIDTAVSGNKIRYLPLAGYTGRMVGGVFEGTNGDPVTGPYSPIYTIATAPPAGWSEVQVSLGSYRYLRYRGAPGSYCVVAEIEFYRAGVKLLGTGYGTAGSWLNRGSTFDKALDGNANTYFSAPTATGNYVGIDSARGSVR